MTGTIVGRFVPATLLAFLAAACGGSSTPTTPTTTTPTTTTVTESFDGTLSQNGSNTHTFSTEAGTVNVTMTAEGPLNTLSLGMDVGTWDGTNCTAVLTSSTAKQGTLLTGTASTAINLCVKVYDVGNISEEATVTYTVTAEHQKKS
jgi:hypothetical protein